MQKAPFLSSLFVTLALFPARADLTIVEKIDGSSNDQMTIKIKGDKARIDASPRMTTIIDAKSGEIIHVINDHKMFLRVPAEKLRAAMEMMNKSAGTSATPAAKPKLVPTGKKETVNGYETEQYTCETPRLKATYWIAPKYPDGSAILQQLKILNATAWKPQNAQLPDYTDFPGIPLKFSIAQGGREITTTLATIKEDPLSDSDFAVPNGFQEMKAPQTPIGKPLPSIQQPSP